MDDSLYLKRTIHKYRIKSDYLPDKGRSLRIYFPPKFQDTTVYPVVYCQDGEQFFNFGRIATLAQKLILEQVCEPFMIIGVDVTLKNRTDEYLFGGSRNVQYMHFFVKELIPWVEKHYLVSRHPDRRLLAGDSLGGTVSLAIALNFPELFHRVISLSGAFYPSFLARIKESSSLEWLSIWMIVGLQETAFSTDHGTFNFLQLNREAVALLQVKGAEVSYEETEGNHIWGFWQKVLPSALEHFLGFQHL